MATPSLRKSSWLALLAGVAMVTAQSRTSQSAFWTWTTRFQDCDYTSEGIYSTYTYTSSCEIKSTVTPTATPYSIDDDYYGYYQDALVTAEYYSSGAVPDSDLEPTYDLYATTTESSSSTTETIRAFSMQVTYTAPTSCPTAFTFTTNASVTVPSQVLDQVTPIAVITSTPSYIYTEYSSYVYETWYLTNGQAPFTSEDDFTYSRYVERCTSPTQYTPYSYPTGSSSGGGSSGGGSGYSSYCFRYLNYGTDCSDVKIWIIVIVALIPTLFVLGIIENYFWFRRLMLGKGCLRFGTISWICITLVVACFTRSQSRRSPDDQKLLRENWRKTSFGAAIKLWLKWGFRHRYPVSLLGQYSRNTVGIVPEGQPLPIPAMAQVNGTYPGGPPPPPGAFMPNGQVLAYYPPPQGWVPGPNGQGYPIPPPGQAYMPGPNGLVQYYGEQPKGTPSVTTASVSGVRDGPQPIPSPVSAMGSPHLSQPANVTEASTHSHDPTHSTAPQSQPTAQLPNNKDSAT